MAGPRGRTAWMDGGGGVKVRDVRVWTPHGSPRAENFPRGGIVKGINSWGPARQGYAPKFLGPMPMQDRLCSSFHASAIQTLDPRPCEQRTYRTLRVATSIENEDARLLRLPRAGEFLSNCGGYNTDGRRIHIGRVGNLELARNAHESAYQFKFGQVVTCTCQFRAGDGTGADADSLRDAKNINAA